MRRVTYRNKQGEWLRYRQGLLGCLIWWAIGAGIGLLFAIALESEMRKALAEHLQTGVSYLVDDHLPQLTYFLKRCLTYAQLLLAIWGLEYFTYGYIGVRILLLARGFLYGFGQVAWVAAYGMKGLWLGILAYWPHNLLFLLAAAWLEWMLHGRLYASRLTAKQTAMLTICIIPVLALVEAYGAPAMFRYFM